MDHLRPHARIEAPHPTLTVDIRNFREEGPGAVHRDDRGPRDGGVEGVCQRLLLNHRAADVGPAVQGRARGACGKAREDIAGQVVGDKPLDARLVEVERQEKAPRPQALPHLHPGVTGHETVETTGLNDVLGDIRGALELALLVQLRGKLNVLEGRDREHLRKGADGSREALAHRRALGLWDAIQGLVNDGLHEELDCTRDRRARDFRHKALLHEAHHAVRVEETPERCARRRAGIRHANRPDDVHGVHYDARHHRASANRWKGVQRGRLALACRGHGVWGRTGSGVGGKRMLDALPSSFP
mmetsp:Transcript_77618/g.215661  ORF Transcript_77618/g.215661 Transcript_77618/m.215661 type:complete len:301 (+) Transcript_77618:139-1041(+)